MLCMLKYWTFDMSEKLYWSRVPGLGNNLRDSTKDSARYLQ